MSAKGELALIDWIRRCGPQSGPAISIGIGDDLAGLRIDGQEVLFGCDQVLDGVHFRLAECGPQAVGRKALARNLSDVAAMAALPVAALASVCLPNAMPAEQAKQIVGGMWELAREFDCPVIGGDVASWDGPLAVSVSILAQPQGVSPVRRGGARPGDVIMVTGQLGGAILGKHLSFKPLVAEARALAQAVDLHALIDISDGLAADLHHITRESSCGARLLAKDIPLSPAAKQLAGKSGQTPLTHALSDGEDYELLFTIEPGQENQAAQVLRSMDAQVSSIGRITESGVLLVEGDGAERELPPAGFEHFTGTK